MKKMTFDNIVTWILIAGCVAFAVYMGFFLYYVNAAMTAPQDHAGALRKSFPNSTVAPMEEAGCDCYKVTDTTSGATWIASWVGGELRAYPIIYAPLPK